ncbi:FAD-dependent oxidoreductase [Oleiagrimonas sp.]|jgi:NADH dehydrogenase FAD-containing subunit|uniref:FAD-dependent oxidoreductase n=1 Tax=Oleiagrimonas sp. TaxID=2010330 RepID=UPI0026072A55|nr:FAD-dependent oxidoreductase [Oleiagrimonas sp.]MDA3914065.1 FAD-dependent oxidoreductase [Oleiagrimonas sp.]
MRRLILAGGGHAHLQVMQYLGRASLPGWEIVLLSPDPEQVYSGMVPGWMAGEHELDACTVPLRPLAQACGVRWAGQALSGMDADQRCVWLANGRRVGYDLLSLNTGAATDAGALRASGDRLLPIKPLGAFSRRWTDFCQTLSKQTRAPRLVLVGGGAGGVELALAARERLGPAARIQLVCGLDGAVPGSAPKVLQRVRRRLRQAGIEELDENAVGAPGGIALDSGKHLAADLVLAATGGVAPDWLAGSQLALGEGGYAAVDAYHRSLSHTEVWAVGDVCSRVDRSLAHSGVHAVRAGAVLARNLHAAMTEGRLRPYRPRAWSLYLLRTRSDHAIASFGPLSAEGAWVAAIKRRIDRGFVARFQVPDAGAESAS